MAIKVFKAQMKAKATMIILPPAVTFEPMSWHDLMYDILIWVLILSGQEASGEGSYLPAWHRRVWALHVTCHSNTLKDAWWATDAPALLKMFAAAWSRKILWKKWFHRKNMNFSSNLVMGGGTTICTNELDS